MKKIRLLKDLRFNPSGKKGAVVDGKIGDIVEVVDHFVDDMVASGAASLDLDAPKKVEKEPEIKDGAPENKADKKPRKTKAE